MLRLITWSSLMVVGTLFLMVGCGDDKYKHMWTGVLFEERTISGKLKNLNYRLESVENEHRIVGEYCRRYYGGLAWRNFYKHKIQDEVNGYYKYGTSKDEAMWIKKDNIIFYDEIEPRNKNLLKMKKKIESEYQDV